jgi:hypothetical protein
MCFLEKHGKKSISKISKISALFRKFFTCRQMTKKNPKRYISYATIEIKCPDSVKSKYVDYESLYESESESKTESNPEFGTVSSVNTLASLVPALHQFKLTTAMSR